MENSQKPMLVHDVVRGLAENLTAQLARREFSVFAFAVSSETTARHIGALHVHRREVSSRQCYSKRQTE